MTHITDEEIAELEELERKATPGEFRCVDDTGIWSIKSYEDKIVHCIMIDGSKEDCEFLAKARNVLPRLLQAYKELKKKTSDLCLDTYKEWDRLNKEIAQKDAVIERMKDVLEAVGTCGYDPQDQRIDWEDAQLPKGTVVKARQCLEEITKMEEGK